jgi:hypothetical protein
MQNPCGISATGNKRSDSPMAVEIGLERVSDNQASDSHRWSKLSLD